MKGMSRPGGEVSTYTFSSWVWHQLMVQLRRFTCFEKPQLIERIVLPNVSKGLVKTPNLGNFIVFDSLIVFMSRGTNVSKSDDRGILLTRTVDFNIGVK